MTGPLDGSPPTRAAISSGPSPANSNSRRVKMTRRFARGFNALVSYTWSKSIDTGASGYSNSGNENGPGGSSAVQDLRHPENDRSVSSYDIPHFFPASVNWEPPV